ncbi:MAG: formylglycine-generating enzyme family protein [Verrucomicrobia bacterium]|nr:MAG: formylglycine-generating enzyme family protein [Verrucomicrobiota bacterium]
MKTFSFFILLTHVAFHSIIYSQNHEASLTKLQIPFVLISDPGNVACASYTCQKYTNYSYYSVNDDINSGYYVLNINIGAVDHSFFISKYEITVSQYCDFLNAVASQNDPHHLYKKEMTEDPSIACINQTKLTKEDGTCFFYYEPFENRGRIPISYVSLNDAKRFCNWLECGAPNNNEDPLFLTECTEQGAYVFSQKSSLEKEETRFNPEAHYYIPSEDEWFKAAYYKGGGKNTGYWAYPTKHDAAPNNGQGDTSNQANYRTLATGWEPREKNPVLTPVDHFDKTSSSYGVCDMGGNVSEWTTSIPKEGTSSHQVERNCVQGGSWNSEYSIYWNNELMAQSPPKAYEPITANNSIGFRIAAIASEKDQDGLLAAAMQHCSHDNIATGTYVTWTVGRGLLFGCPITMIDTIFKFIGYDAATTLGVTSLEGISFSVVSSILLLDLIGYIAVMAGLQLLGKLIPWSSLGEYFTRSTSSPKDSIITPITTENPHESITIKESIVQSLWSFVRSLIGCGMCLLTAFLSTFRLIAARLGIGEAFLEKIKDFFIDIQLADSAYVPEWLVAYIPPWLIYRIVPVVLELGFIGLFIFGCYEFSYYWPAIQDSLAQFWYGTVNYLGTSSLDLPGAVY